MIKTIYFINCKLATILRHWSQRDNVLSIIFFGEMSMALINTAVQPFTAQAFKNGEFIEVSEKDIANKWAIFVFYPADFTFVCPTELGDVQDKYAELQQMGVEVFSVSTDTHFVHKAWHDASDTIGKIEYTMIGDPNGVITTCLLYTSDAADE